MSKQYVAVVQQGMVGEQHAIKVYGNEANADAAASAEAKRRNDAQGGFGEGWTGVALLVER